MRNFLLLSVTLLLASCASSPKEVIDHSNFEMINYGLFKTQTDFKEELSSSPTGQMTRSGDRVHLKTTSAVPAELDTRFGVEYVIRANRLDRVVLDFVWTPSAPVIGKSGKKYEMIKYSKVKATNKFQYAGYILSIENEMKPDTWKLQIFSNDILLHETTFEIE